jgi:outer membrane protein TolC
MSIDKEVAEARINIRSALATMDFQKKNMQLAEEVYNQTKLKYEQGLGSNLEITNSQTELTTAQNNYYSALYDAIVARVDFLRATGKL